MANEIEVKIPDIGGATQVDVIEVMVKVGDPIEIDTPLITLESEKASMEIPSPVAGKITKIVMKVGDKVAEGDVILQISAQDTATTEPQKTSSPEPEVESKPEPEPKPQAVAQKIVAEPSVTESETEST